MPPVLTVGVGEVVWSFFSSRLSFLFSFSRSLGDGSIRAEIMSQRVVKPQNNRPSSSYFGSKSRLLQGVSSMKPFLP